MRHVLLSANAFRCYNIDTQSYLRVGSPPLTFSKHTGWIDLTASATNSNADGKGETKTMGNKRAPDAPGMQGYRSRNESGPLRKKRSDTLVKTIEKQYDVDFKVRGDMQLGTLLKKTGEASLNDLMRKQR